MVTHKTYPIWSWCPSKVDTTFPLFSDDTIFLIKDSLLLVNSVISVVVIMTSSVKSMVSCTLQRTMLLQNFWSVSILPEFHLSPLIVYFLRIQASFYLQLFVEWLTSLEPTIKLQFLLVWLRVTILIESYKKSQGTQDSAWKVLSLHISPSSQLNCFFTVTQVTEMTLPKFN